MKNLDNVWKLLIAIGIAFLLGYAALSIMRSLGGGGSEFRQTINPLDNSTLISDPLERHLNTAPSTDN